MSDNYSQLVLAIVKGQEAIIGPVAWDQASSVSGLRMERPESVAFNANVDKKRVVENLVSRFEDFFGKAAVQVCKDAAGKISKTMDPSELPESLK